MTRFIFAIGETLAFEAHLTQHRTPEENSGTVVRSSLLIISLTRVVEGRIHSGFGDRFLSIFLFSYVDEPEVGVLEGKRGGEEPRREVGRARRK